jgi:hypothetical protein
MRFMVCSGLKTSSKVSQNYLLSHVLRADSLTAGQENVAVARLGPMSQYNGSEVKPSEAQEEQEKLRSMALSVTCDL